MGVRGWPANLQHLQQAPAAAQASEMSVRRASLRLLVLNPGQLSAVDIALHLSLPSSAERG